MTIHNKVVCVFFYSYCFTPAFQCTGRRQQGGFQPSSLAVPSYYPSDEVGSIPLFTFLSFSSDEGGFNIPLVGILWAVQDKLRSPVQCNSIFTCAVQYTWKSIRCTFLFSELDVTEEN
jgi:hypothetical protein